MLLNRITALIIFIATASVSFVQMLTYEQTISLIQVYNAEKHYSVATNGLMLDLIIQGFIDNANDTLSEGLKKRLDAGLTVAKLKQDVSVAADADTGALLDLLYNTRESIPLFISDKDLLDLVGGKKGTGTMLIKGIINYWNMYESLEDFEPSEATKLVEVVAKPWFNSTLPVYETSDPSWASRSLQKIYTDARTVELAQKSVVVKLLANMGCITIPAYTEADFAYSGWPSIAINLPAVNWSVSDVPELRHLTANSYYGEAAIVELKALGH